MRRIYKWMLFMCLACVGILYAGNHALAAGESFTVKATPGTDNKVKLEIRTASEEISGYVITRSTERYGTYTEIADVKSEEDWWTEEIGADYTDPTVYQPYSYVYYKVKAYSEDEDGNRTDRGIRGLYTAVRNVPPNLYYGRKQNYFSAGLRWTRDRYADGYVIYYCSNYDRNSNYKYVDVTNPAKYTYCRGIGRNNLCATVFNNLMNGVTYSFRVYAYKRVNGRIIYSHPSNYRSITIDTFSYGTESYYNKTRRAFGSEAAKAVNFRNKASADRQMTTIRIAVWDFANGRNGTKVTRYKYLTVNKRLAPSIQQMFREIYYSSERQVIHDIGCYSYREGEHKYGMAIDINANENYMIDDGKVLAGSFWDPKRSAYSIPLNCQMVRIMERYGFYRGFWGDRKDYMHFSFFGT